MRFSVCIPVFNMARTLAATLQSALAQTHADYEVLLVDNGSTDGTWEMANAVEHPRLRVVQNERNLGAYGNHNRCLELAHGEWVKFLHGDDELLPDCLSQLDRALENVTPELGLVACGAICLGQDDQETGRTQIPPVPFITRNAPVLEFAQLGNIVGTPSMTLIHRKKLLAVGGFDLAIEPAADNDCWITMRRSYWTLFVPLHLVKIRDDPAPGIVKRDGALARECSRIVREIRKWWQVDERWARRPLEQTPYGHWMFVELLRFWAPGFKYLSRGHGRLLTTLLGEIRSNRLWVEFWGSVLKRPAHFVFPALAKPIAWMTALRPLAAEIPPDSAGANSGSVRASASG